MASVQCDFCRSRQPRWQYGCKTFQVANGFDLTEQPLTYDGDWLACQPCHEDIEANRWDDVAGRIIRQLMLEEHADYQTVVALTEAAHRGFRAHRTGKHWELPRPTTQASVYSRALDLQSDLAQRLSRPDVYEAMLKMGKRFNGKDLGQQMADLIRFGVTRSEAGYVSTFVCQLLEQTLQSVPDTPLVSEDLLVPNGFMMLQQPLPLPFTDGAHASLTREAHAIAWFSYGWSSEMDASEMRHGIYLAAWCAIRGSPMLAPVNSMTWAFGDSWQQASAQWDTDAERQVSERVGRWMIALNAFCHQQLITGRRGAPERAVRRRMERAGKAPSDVLVVELRRVQQHRSDPTGRHIAEDFSFSVSGHWRRQWYESIQDHRPRWISPYIKGNTDAPLRPRRRVFAIVH